MTPVEYLHVDVFGEGPYGGNSLPVFHACPDLAPAAMLAITRELRHFEAIFLQPEPGLRRVKARVFDLIEELPFAGHPIIGAAAALQHLSAPRDGGVWTFDLTGRTVHVEIEARDAGYFGVLDQGAPRFLGEVDDRAAVARAFSLGDDDLDPRLPLEAASTGLRYLVVPLRPERIGAARIGADITGLVEAHGAQFAVLFDPATFEIRHWNNDGVMEDVATGSAAGVVGAYALKHGLASPGRRFALSQGRFTGRPSRLEVQADAAGGAITSVKVGGHAAIVGRGRLDVLPEVGS